ncbi:MAG TPA: hypothetical protein DIT95_18150 [Arenibacter sp.]|nr:hypothetical protein [Arenibacter sp.]
MCIIYIFHDIRTLILNNIQKIVVGNTSLSKKDSDNGQPHFDIQILFQNCIFSMVHSEFQWLWKKQFNPMT